MKIIQQTELSKKGSKSSRWENTHKRALQAIFAKNIKFDGWEFEAERCLLANFGKLTFTKERECWTKETKTTVAIYAVITSKYSIYCPKQKVQKLWIKFTVSLFNVSYRLNVQKYLKKIV